jgi:hypothetical protein
MSTRATAKWVGLALLGLLIAIAVAIAGSSLASRQIGLASEPISAGDALAPRGAGETPATSQPAPEHPEEGSEDTAPAETPEGGVEPPVAQPSGGSDDSQGGRGGGDGDADD